MTPARPFVSLDGDWDFAFEGGGLSIAGATIRTPGLWQTQFPQTRQTPGVGRYRRRVTIPPEWRGRSLHLVLEGVFHETTILIDERPVARHGDGWTTIEVDLTTALAGRSSFVLGIDATLPDERGLGATSLGETLAAKQDWYGLQGGIWKPARLEARAPLHLAEVAARTTLRGDTGVATVRATLSGAPAGATLRLRLRRDG